MDRVFVLSAGFTAVCAALVLLWRIMTAVVCVAHHLDRAWDDWSGTGGRPGVIPRLNQAEGRITALEQPPA